MSAETKHSLQAVALAVTLLGTFTGAITFANRVENKVDNSLEVDARQDRVIQVLEEKRAIDHDKLTRIDTTLSHIDKGIEEIKLSLKKNNL